MKKTALIISLLLVTSCYAYKVANTKNYIQEAQQQVTEESLKLKERLDARLPARSLATTGKVIKRKLELINFSYSIFIIGDDAPSRKWLKDHAQEIEEKNALGFVTNIESKSNLQKLQQLVKAPLLPANVDDLLALFKENHYPLMFHEGELWQ